jgi:hypothetical protein
LEDSRKEAVDLGKKLVKSIEEETISLKKKYQEEFKIMEEIFDNESRGYVAGELAEGSKEIQKMLELYKKAGVEVKYTSFDLPRVSGQGDFGKERSDAIHAKQDRFDK